MIEQSGQLLDVAFPSHVISDLGLENPCREICRHPVSEFRLSVPLYVEEV